MGTANKQEYELSPAELSKTSAGNLLDNNLQISPVRSCVRSAIRNAAGSPVGYPWETPGADVSELRLQQPADSLSEILSQTSSEDSFSEESCMEAPHSELFKSGSSTPSQTRTRTLLGNVSKIDPEMLSSRRLSPGSPAREPSSVESTPPASSASSSYSPEQMESLRTDLHAWENPLKSRTAVIAKVLEFCPVTDFLFLAGVSTRWRFMWTAVGRPRVTSARLAGSTTARIRWLAGEASTFEDAAGGLPGGVICLAARAGNLAGLQEAAAISAARLRSYGDIGVEAVAEEEYDLDENIWTRGNDAHQVTAFAAEGGHLDVLQWARAQGCHWDARTCSFAALGGHLRTLQWLREQACPWDSGVAQCAARNGHLLVLQWARSQECPWDENTCSFAAGGGHLNILMWARAHGCPWSVDTCNVAGMFGHLRVLQWARRHGCPWDESTASSIAAGGHLDILTWARANGCPWDSHTGTNAAYGGHLSLLQWALEEECSWDNNQDIGNIAAERGYLEMLQWARTEDYIWDEQICTLAAKGGHLELLEWARQNGCPWDGSTCLVAAQFGQLDVLRWARFEGCPWDKQACLEMALWNGYVAVAEWVRVQEDH